MTKLTLLATGVLTGVLALGACDRKDPDAAGVVPEAKPVSMAAPPVTKVTPAVAAPVAYSPEAVAKLLVEVEPCVHHLACEPFKTLVAFGAPAAPDLLAYSLDATKKKYARQVTLKALADIGAPVGGKELFAAAQAETDVGLRPYLYEAAGATKSDDVFALATAELLTDAGRKNRIDLLKVLAPSGKKAFDWAAAGLPKAKGRAGYDYALVMAESATAAELPVMQAAIASSKDAMVRHHLASAAVKLGDDAQLQVLYTGLAAKDVYDRSDAGNMLANVMDKIPAADQPKVLELAIAAKGTSKDSMLNHGLDKLIAKLGK